MLILNIKAEKNTFDVQIFEYFFNHHTDQTKSTAVQKF
jgi:hypothetical protein